MEGNKLLSIIVTLTVGIIFVGAMLGPIIDDASDTEKTFTNDGLWRMKEIENGDSWARNGDAGSWTYNGTDTITPDSSFGGSNIALGDDWCVRSNGQLRGHTIGGNPTSPSFTAGDDLVTFTTGGGLNGNPYQSLTGYGYDSTGAYVMLPYGESAYMNGDSALFATGSSTVDGAAVIVHIEGTINDADIEIVVDSNFVNSGTPTLGDLVITNKQVNYTKVEGYVDLYKLESITFDASFSMTLNDTTTNHSGSVAYSSYVVPYQVTAELSEHLDMGSIAILAAVPLMAIAALLLLVVRYFTAGRD